MNPLLHAFFVHFPIALGFLVPLLILWTMVQFKRNEATANTLWVTVVLPLTMMTVFTVLGIMVGDLAHEALEKYMDEKPIKTHEEFAEIFAMLLYITTGLSFFVFLFKAKRRFQFMVIVLALSVVTLGLGMATGKTGGDVVHEHDAPHFMLQAIKDGVLEKLGKHSHEEAEEETKENSEDTGNVETKTPAP